MSDAIFDECKQRMRSSVDALRRELSTLRAGKATPALLEGLRVEAYGSQTPLNQVGSVGAPEPRLLVVQPWDKSLIGAIERAIRSSNLGLNPSNDGVVVRVPIPALTEERRRDLVKVAHGYAEEGRVSVRAGRRDANTALKKGHKDGDLSEDEEKRGHARVQELTDQCIKEIDGVLAAKEQEILEI